MCLSSTRSEVFFSESNLRTIEEREAVFSHVLLRWVQALDYLAFCLLHMDLMSLSLKQVPGTMAPS